MARGSFCHFMLFASVMVILSCEKPPAKGHLREPTRALGVPQDAVWAGNEKGGAWFVCSAVGAERDRYECSVYDETTGGLWAKGSYILRRVRWDESKGAAEYMESTPPATLDYSAFDGVAIRLEGDLVLLPDGEIDYPMGDGHGKQQQYRVGVPTGPDRAY